MNTARFPIPASLARLGARLSIDTESWKARGRLALRVDGYPRLSLRPARGESLELQARLRPLPTPARERELLIDALMLRVTAHAATHVAVPTLSPDGEHLLLQATLSEEGPRTVEEGFESFLNDLDYWTAVLKELA